MAIGFPEALPDHVCDAVEPAERREVGVLHQEGHGVAEKPGGIWRVFVDYCTRTSPKLRPAILLEGFSVSHPFSSTVADIVDINEI